MEKLTEKGSYWWAFLLKNLSLGKKNATIVLRNFDHLLLREVVYILVLVSVYTFSITRFTFYDFVAATVVGYGLSFLAAFGVLTSKKFYHWLARHHSILPPVNLILLLLTTLFISLLNHPVSLYIAFTALQLIRVIYGIETSIFQASYWKNVNGKSAYEYSQTETPIRLLGFVLLLLISYWSAANHLLWIGCALQGVLIILRKSPQTDVFFKDSESVKSPFKNFLKQVFKGQKFLVSLSVVLFSLATFSYLLKILAINYLQQRLLFESSSMLFLTTFFIIVFLLTWAFSLVLTPRLCGRIGLRKTLSILPASVILVFLIGWSLYWVNQHSFPFWNIIIAWGLLIIFERNTQKIALATLISPFQHLVESKGSLWIDLMFRPLFQFIVAVFLLVLVGQELYSNDLAVLILSGASLSLLIISIGIKKPFLQHFQKSLNLRLIRESDITYQEKSVKAIIEDKAKSGESLSALFSLNLLKEMNSSKLEGVMVHLVGHSNPLIRREVIAMLGKPFGDSLINQLFQQVHTEEEAIIKTEIAKKYFQKYKGENSLSELFLSADSAVIKGGLSGLLLSENKELREQGEIIVAEMACSAQFEDKILACEIIAETNTKNLYEALVLMMGDSDEEVRKQAINACPLTGDSRLISHLLEHIRTDDLALEATSAVMKYEQKALPELDLAIQEALRETSPLLLQLAAICTQIGGSYAHQLLWKMVEYPWEELQENALQGLASTGFVAKQEVELNYVKDQIEKIISRLYWYYSALNILVEKPSYGFLFDAMEQEVQHQMNKLERLLSLIFDQKVSYLMSELEIHPEFASAWQDEGFDGEENEIENELWEVMPADLAEKYLAVYGYYSYEEKVAKLSEFYSIQLFDEYSVLTALLESSSYRGLMVSRWTKASAIYSTTDIANQAVLRSLAFYLKEDDLLLVEPALKAVKRYCQYRGFQLKDLLEELVENPVRINLLLNMASTSTTLMEIEKVIILKSTRMFSDTPENLLTDVATVLKEVRVNKGQVLFRKGEPGDSMYIIYEGQIRIHDDSRTYTNLINGDFFGDLGILDTKPRSANATAQMDSLLLKLDQEDFYSLMQKRPEMVKSIIQVLCERIRNQDRLISEKGVSEHL